MRGWIVTLSDRGQAIGAALALLSMAACQDVTVSPIEIASIEVEPNPVSVVEGETLSVSAVLREPGGEILEGRQVVWASDDAAVASVSDDGVIEGVEAGRTVIRAVAESAEGTAEVSVLAGPSIDLPGALTLDVRPGRTDDVAVAVKNGGEGELTGLEVDVEIDDGANTGWLTAELEDSTAPTTLHLTLNARGLRPGIYIGRVVMGSPVARNGPQTLEVTLAVIEPRPRIAVSDSSVALSAVAGQTASQVLTVENAGGGTLEAIDIDITYPEDEPDAWLSGELDSSAAPAELTLRANARGLDPCTCHATVEVSSRAAENDGVEVEVTFTVTISDRQAGTSSRGARPTP